MKKDTKLYLIITIVLTGLIFLVMFVYWQLDKMMPAKILIGSLFLVVLVGGMLIYISTLERKATYTELDQAEEVFKSYWLKKTNENLSYDLGSGVTYEGEGKKYFGFLFQRSSGSKKGAFLVGVVEGPQFGVISYYDVPSPQLQNDPLYNIKKDIMAKKYGFIRDLKEKEKNKNYAVPTVPIDYHSKEPQGDFESG